jgi:antitoxin VapB
MDRKTRNMALSIKHTEADRLARQLAQKAGETPTQAVVAALRERLEREQVRAPAVDLVTDLRAIGKRVAALPVLDPRRPEEVLGYDEHGLAR